MSDTKSNKKDKSKDLTEEYSWKLYNKLSQENFKRAERDHRWTISNFNKNDREISNRLFWFSGIAISIIPIIANTNTEELQLLPTTTSEKIFFITIITSLSLSMISGLINYFIENLFWRNKSEKYMQNMMNWDKARTTSEVPYRLPILEFNKCLSYEIALNLNEKPFSSPWARNAQIGLSFFGFILEIIYIVVKLI